MDSLPLRTAIDALRYLAWMAAAGFLVYDQAGLMCLAIIVAVGLGYWLDDH